MSVDERIAIWNVLHDGDITAVSKNGDMLTLFVNIPYLRRRLQPLGDSFVLKMTKLKRCEFRNFDGTTSPLSEELEIGTPEIIKTDSESMPAAIETTMGQLILDFENISFALDTGEDTDFETIERAFDDYWKEWQAKGHRDPSA